MTRVIFAASLGLCLLFTGLSQISDPGILGFNEEPERILFYGGSGLLAGLFGLLGLGSGIYIWATRFRGTPGSLRWLMVVILLIVLTAVLAALMIRFDPF